MDAAPIHSIDKVVPGLVGAGTGPRDHAAHRDGPPSRTRLPGARSGGPLTPHVRSFLAVSARYLGLDDRAGTLAAGD